MATVTRSVYLAFCEIFRSNPHVHSLSWRQWWSVSRGASLFRQRREILLTCLQRGSILSGSAFPVHSKPNRPNHYSYDAGGYVLCDLPALLVREFLSFCVIGLDLRPDHRAIRIHVLRLHACNRCRIAACACRQCEADGHCPEDLRTHSPPPLKGPAPPLLSSNNQEQRTRVNASVRRIVGLPFATCEQALHQPPRQYAGDAAPVMAGRKRRFHRHDLVASERVEAGEDTSIQRAAA